MNILVYTPSSSSSSSSSLAVSSFVSLATLKAPSRDTFTTSGSYSSLILSGEPTLAAKRRASPSTQSNTTPSSAPFEYVSLMYCVKSVLRNVRSKNTEPSLRSILT